MFERRNHKEGLEYTKQVLTDVKLKLGIIEKSGEWRATANYLQAGG